MFENLVIEDDIKSGGDVLGGNSKFRTVDSNLYPCTVQLAYETSSMFANGAKELAVVLETEDGIEIKQTFRLTSSASEGCLPYYVTKKGVKIFRAGFENANHLCMLTLEKKINQVEWEEKTINLYDFAQRAEVPTSVKMIKGITGTKVVAGIIKRKANKKMKDSENNWIALTDIKETNVIDKFFQPGTGLTCTELAAEETVADFANKWSEKWSGVTEDKTSSDAIPDPRKENGGATTNGTTTPKKSLFGGASE